MTRGGASHGASLQVAGQSLIEYQARSLAACGARHIVVMVETLPAALLAAFDRLRGEGFSIDTARTAQDAADRLHPDETVFVLSPGVVASESVLQSLAAAPAPVVATLRDEAASGRFERIDREDRWGGVATVRGEHLRKTCAQLGEWDFAATTLRVALQHGASRVAVPDDAFVGYVENPGDAANASTRLAVVTAQAGSSPFDRWIATPLASLGLGQALRLSLPFEIVSVVPPTILLAALLTGWIGWPALGLVGFAIAKVAHGIAAGLAACALRRSRAIDHYPLVATGGFAILVLLGATSWAESGWGSIALALWLVANMLLLRTESRRWHPEAADLALVIAAAAIAGAPVAGLIVAIGWQLVQPSIDRARTIF